jgi:hypothetical protein
MCLSNIEILGVMQDLELHLRTVAGLISHALCRLTRANFTGPDLGRLVRVELDTLTCCW